MSSFYSSSSHGLERPSTTWSSPTSWVSLGLPTQLFHANINIFSRLLCLSALFLVLLPGLLHRRILETYLSKAILNLAHFLGISVKKKNWAEVRSSRWILSFKQSSIPLPWTLLSCLYQVSITTPLPRISEAQSATPRMLQHPPSQKVKAACLSCNYYFSQLSFLLRK